MTSWWRGAVEPHVVGHEGAAGQPLDHRVAHVGRHNLVAVVHVRLGVVGERGGLGQAGQHVQRRQGAGGVENARRLGGHTCAQRLEELELALEDPLVGAEHLLLVLLERGRDEALAAGNGLLAVIVGRHRVEVRLRHLDVVAEHAIEADLQRGDAGARALLLLHLGDDLLARAADVAQLVELGVDAVAHEPAVARQRRRLVLDGRFDPAADVGQVVELAARGCGPAAPRHRRAAARPAAPRPATARRAARSRGPAVDSAMRDISRSRSWIALNASRTLPRSVACDGEALRPRRADRGCARATTSGRSSHARSSRPPIGGDGPIDLVQERALAGRRPSDSTTSRCSSVVGSISRLSGALLEPDGADVGELGLLRVAQVAHQRAGRARPPPAGARGRSRRGC